MFSSKNPVVIYFTNIIKNQETLIQTTIVTICTTSSTGYLSLSYYPNLRNHIKRDHDSSLLDRTIWHIYYDLIDPDYNFKLLII